MTEEQRLAQKKYQREWYQKNRERVLARTKEYYHANKEKYQEYGRDYYRRDPEKHKAKATEKGRKRREWFNEYKSTLSCIKCGESHPSTLDFHHRDPLTKEHTVSQLIGGCRSMKTILAEIEKCDVLCANCHRKLHHDLKTNQETTVG